MGKKVIELNTEFFETVSFIKCVFNNPNILEIKVRGALKISHGECFCIDELSNNTDIIYAINNLIETNIVEVTRFYK